MQQMPCAHCGKSFSIAVLRRHAEKCFRNPEYIAQLRQDIPPDISSSEYDRISSEHGLPNLARLRANFGKFQQFLDWLHEVDDVIDVIGTELSTNRLALRSDGEGLPVLKTYQNRRGETCYVLR